MDKGELYMILNRFKTETTNGTDNTIHYHWRSSAGIGHHTG